MGNAQAGWYDDGAGKKRWWDGEKWTDDVQPQADAGGGLAGMVPKIETDAVAGAQPRPYAQGASYVVLQVILKEKLWGTGSGNLTELEKAINTQAALGYRLHTRSSSTSRSRVRPREKLQSADDRRPAERVTHGKPRRVATTWPPEDGGSPGKTRRQESMTKWIGPEAAEYDERRALFNTMIDKRPRIIAACEGPADVREALERAAHDLLPVAVRSGGHSVAGQSTNDDGLVIDVRPMKTIEIDPRARRARVAGGCTWAEFDAAAQEFGLATTGGRVSTTGVSGLTLGGGSGWLERQHGLSCDNLLAVELVTADGREIRADLSQHQDLLWASKGGGGNFGVVTALEFQLHPVGPVIIGGLMAWPAARGPEVSRVFRDWADNAPEELGTGLVMLSGPPEEFIPPHLQGQPLIAIAVCWNGDEATGTDLVQVMRDLSPEVDLVGQMPYAELQSMIDDPPGFRQYWSADYHDSFPDDALDLFLDAGARRASPMTQHLLLPWGGALGRVDADATPLSQRAARWVSHPFATWEDPADDEANIAWVRDYRKGNAPFTTGGVYLNFIGDEGDERIKAAFGAKKYERLAQIKAEYDPGNVFAGNQNIRPKVPA